MITIKTIAKKANVSTATVDRVLHNRGKVAPETEKRIKQILKELEFRPNVFARTLKLQKNFNFGVLMPELIQDSAYWKAPVQGIEKAKSELSGYNVNINCYHYDKYSKRSFKQAISKIKKMNLDGILIAPVSSKSVTKCIENIPARIPYVFFDSNVPDSRFISFIGQDAFQSGVLSAKLIDILCNDNGSIIVFRVLPDDYHINSRVQGFSSYFKSKYNYHIHTYDINGNGNQKMFKKNLEKVIGEHPDLHGIFITNVCSHKIAEQVKNLEKQNHIHIVGYDLINENIQYLKEGVVDFLISQRPEIQGYRGIYTLYRHVVLKEVVKKEIFMQLDVVAKENIDYYQKCTENRID